jgi:hypothetical protein
MLSKPSFPSGPLLELVPNFPASVPCGSCRVWRRSLERARQAATNASFWHSFSLQLQLGAGLKGVWPHWREPPSSTGSSRTRRRRWSVLALWRQALDSLPRWLKLRHRNPRGNCGIHLTTRTRVFASVATYSRRAPVPSIVYCSRPSQGATASVTPLRRRLERQCKEKKADHRVEATGRSGSLSLPAP